ncbi:MAG: hypothetical protein WC091_05695, partial [Sulfuricellaceae bacterium]
RNQKTYSREAAKNAKKNQGRFGFFRGFAASREKFFSQMAKTQAGRLPEPKNIYRRDASDAEIL